MSHDATLYYPERNSNIRKIMSKSSKNAQRVVEKEPLQASTSETPAKIERGLKRPAAELAAMIHVVNLMSENDPADAPRRMTEDEFMAWLETLSPDLADYLLADLNARREYSGWPIELVIPFVLEIYQEIVAAREAFNRLFTHKAYEAHGHPYFGTYIPTACHLVINEGRIDISLSMFGRAIRGAELDYIRRCEIETCGRIFYAGRKNQNCCSVQCAKKRRQQKWRSKYGKPVLTKQEEIKLNKKKKRAKTAP